ncbi:MAG: hypothetical protein ACODAE_03895 [Gemmatimonadota bacterium]
MRKSLIVFTAVAVAASGACRTAEVETEPDVQPAPRPATADAVPAGTLFRVELDQTIGTERNRVGDRFTATVAEPLIARNGEVVVPAGARIHGVITGLDESDRIGDQAAIRIDMERISFRGRSYPFSAGVVDTDVELDEDTRELAERAAIGAAAGAALGAIIGGDLEDILIGGALGAGAGTVISLGLGRVDAELPRGTEMTLRTTREIRLE